jgi:hypothetical protein
VESKEHVRLSWAPERQEVWEGFSRPESESSQLGMKEVVWGSPSVQMRCESTDSQNWKRLQDFLSHMPHTATEQQVHPRLGTG